MAEHHGGVVADHPHPVSAVGVTSGTLTTPRGPITWTAAENGTVHAEGGGQQLTSTGRSETNGSWHQHQVVARDHGAVYLTIDSVVDATSRKVAVTLQAGTSHLTLAVSGIDARVTSGTAHVSGAVRGSAVHWTGRVDLTSNPFVGNPIPGWPKGVFDAELKEASFFAPLAKELAPHAPPPPHGPGTGGGHVIASAGGVIGRAGAWCLGGAIAGSAAGPETLGTSIGLGCIGGATASLLNDLVTWSDEDDVQPEPPPPIDLPLDPEPLGPVTQTQPDDPPPPPTGGQDPGGQDPGGEGDPGGGDGGAGNGVGGADGGGDGNPDDDRPGHRPD